MHSHAVGLASKWCKNPETRIINRRIIYELLYCADFFDIHMRNESGSREGPDLLSSCINWILQDISRHDSITDDLHTLIQALDRQHQIRLCKDAKIETYQLLRLLVTPGLHMDAKQLRKLLPGNCLAETRRDGDANDLSKAVLAIRQRLLSECPKSIRIPEMIEVAQMWFSEDMKFCYTVCDTTNHEQMLCIHNLSEGFQRPSLQLRGINTAKAGPQGSIIVVNGLGIHFLDDEGQPLLHMRRQFHFPRVIASNQYVVFFEGLCSAHSRNSMMYRTIDGSQYNRVPSIFPQGFHSISFSRNNRFVLVTTITGILVLLLGPRSGTSNDRISHRQLSSQDGTVQLLSIDLHFDVGRALISNESDKVVFVHRQEIHFWWITYDSKPGYTTINITDGEVLSCVPRFQEPNSWYVAAFSPDSRYLALGDGRSGEIIFLKTTDGVVTMHSTFRKYADSRANEFTGRPTMITALAWSPDSCFLGIGDGVSVNLFDVSAQFTDLE